MSRRECAREPEVIERVLCAQGTIVLGDELQGHVEGCPVCGDLLKVIDMLHQDHARAAADVTVPAAGQVWWRAAVRARLEAAQAAARPMTWATGMTGATLVGVTCAVVLLTWPALRRMIALTWGGWTQLWDVSAVPLLPPIVAALERSLPLALVVIAAVVLTPLLVLYFALAGED
jgi:hypothetical protein